MDSYCRNCYYPFKKSMLEYYKPIMSQGFPICIKCLLCVDCCQDVCDCVRCQDCLEIIDICRCDNDPMQYSNSESAFNHYSPQNNYQYNDLINRFSNMQIRETPYIEEIMDDMMEI